MWMEQALVLAAEAAAEGEVPVGALVVDAHGAVLGQGANCRESASDPVAHAEILAIQAAARALRNWRLEKTTLYVTQEPCPMCAGAIVNARISRLVYGCDNPKAGAVRTLYQLVEDPRLNHRVEVTSGVMADECGKILTGFFSALRNSSKMR